MKKLLSYALSAAALLATSAFAQDTAYNDTYTDPNRPAYSDMNRKPDLATKVGMEVQVGGGVQGFLDRDASSIAQPYAVAGYTWRRYSVTNSAVNTSSVAEADNVSAIPLGIGLAYRFSHLVADLRVTFHGAFGRELIPNANLSTYSTDAKVGFEF